MCVQHRRSGSTMVTIAKVGRGRPASREYQILHEIADKMRPIVQGNLVKGMKTFRGRIDLNAIVKAVRAGDTALLDSLIPWGSFKDDIAEMGPTLNRGLVRSGEKSSAFFSRSIAALIPGVVPRIKFNAENPRIQRLITSRVDNISQGITNKSRDALKRIMAQSINEGVPARESAKLIKQSIGLTDRQTQALRKFKGQIAESGIKGARADSVIAKFADRQLNIRAKNIARTETVAITNLGQKEVWNQAAEEGLYDPQKSTKVWVVTPDDLLCPICEPLEGVEVAMNEGWNTDAGFVTEPPAHPSCRCAMNINLPSA